MKIPDNVNPDWTHCLQTPAYLGNLISAPCDLTWTDNSKVWVPYQPQGADLSYGGLLQWGSNTGVCMDCGIANYQCYSYNCLWDNLYQRFSFQDSAHHMANFKIVGWIDDTSKGYVAATGCNAASVNQRWTIACRAGQTPYYGANGQALGCQLCPIGNTLIHTQNKPK